jgi:N-formylglutamate deformylase
MQVRQLIQGTAPLLISIPHMGTYIPADIKSRMTEAALRLPDTDWHVDKLYWFAKDMGASILMSTHSRYVIDLNRPQDDSSLYPGQLKTGLCPLQTFAGENIYKDGEEPDAIEKANRIGAYWLPYHETLEAELQRIKAEHGRAVLYDAHSIKSVVPLLFDGRLPDLNIGTAKGASCGAGIGEKALAAASGRGYTTVLNGRFIGGYITRHYGRPQEGIYALQMELVEANYMDENYPYTYDSAKAANLQRALKAVLESLLSH